MFDLNKTLQLAKKARLFAANSSDEQRHELLLKMAAALRENQQSILAANQKDLDRMEDSNPKKDRLLLDPERLQDMAQAVESVAILPCPDRKVITKNIRENQLEITRQTTPLGVIAMIYEARPNVTTDAASLALRAGNSIVLRGGSDAQESNQEIIRVLEKVLDEQNWPTQTITLLPPDREFVKPLLEAHGLVDLVIPRGSRGLIDFVREHARIPVIETGAGVCHTYIDSEADLDLAIKVVDNAKTRRVSICNVLDTILVHQDIATTFFAKLAAVWKTKSVQIWADQKSLTELKQQEYPHVNAATPQDFGREFLSMGCSVKVVLNEDEALQHIDQYSSRHSEAIISRNQQTLDKFLLMVDAAAVYSNTSTQFTDGGEFGLGAEIGVSTQKLHARGPFALEKLVTEKWIVRGNGQVRP